MPLADSLLAAELTVNRANLGNTPASAGQKQAQAVANFWLTGLGPGGAAVLSVASGPIMTPGMIAAYSVNALAVINAKKVAKAVDTGMKAVILIGGIYGVHIMVQTPGDAGLAAELQQIWDSQQPSPALVAQKEAKAIKNYTIQCTAFGTGIPPVIPPQQGPIT